MREIFDEIVGFIDLDETEEKLFSNLLVARLGNIKQLGLAYATFPGANHTRLSHSLGTMHYAGEIAKALRRSSNRAIRDSLFNRKMRAAGLLHDIGHPPLSHTLEHPLRRIYDSQSSGLMVKKKTKGGIGNHPIVKEIEKLLEGPGGNPFDNSVVSALLVSRSSISKILERNGLSPDDIAKTIAGTQFPEYHSQVLDAGLDADKMDYLQRDKHGTGVPYGIFDIQQILRCLRLENKLICVDENGANACLHFLLIRYFWYTQVILNRNVHAFEEMAERMYRSLAHIGLLPTPLEILDRLQDIVDGKAKAEDWWAGLDDNRFVHAMSEAAKNHGRSKRGKKPYPLSPEDLVDFIRRVQNRSPLQRVVRIDAVEIPRRGVGQKVAYENTHPLIGAYHKFTDWLEENRRDDMNSGRIIVSERWIEVAKKEFQERPIFVKTQYDPKPIALQQHYYSVILPMAVNFPDHPIRFAAKRVFCVDKLLQKLRLKFDHFAKP